MSAATETSFAAATRNRHQLLLDLRRQLPNTHGRFRDRTERAIEQIETELAGGRDTAAKAATK